MKEVTFLGLPQARPGCLLDSAGAKGGQTNGSESQNGLSIEYEVVARHCVGKEHQREEETLTWKKQQSSRGLRSF
jgi:hypothetical protein